MEFSVCDSILSVQGIQLAKYAYTWGDSSGLQSMHKERLLHFMLIQPFVRTPRQNTETCLQASFFSLHSHHGGCLCLLSLSQRAFNSLFKSLEAKFFILLGSLTYSSVNLYQVWEPCLLLSPWIYSGNTGQWDFRKEAWDVEQSKGS